MSSLRYYKIVIIFSFLSFIIAGCSSTKLETPLTEGEALKVLYDNALGLVKKRDYVDAAILFEDIERQYPYSKWSSQAQLMGAFCYYKSNMHDDSLNSIERFISLYPANEKIGYATYLTALNYYAQIQDVSRDQSMTEQALISFNEVINRYKDTDFAIDSKNKIDVINDRLAAKEIEIARFYQFDSQWIAAINRYNLILNKYGVMHDRDHLSVSIGQPNRVETGTMTFRIPELADSEGNLTYANREIDLNPSGRQIDFGIDYVTKLDNDLILGFKHTLSKDFNHIDSSALNNTVTFTAKIDF